MNFQNEEFPQIDELDLLTETSDDVDVGIYCKGCERIVPNIKFSTEFDRCWDCVDWANQRLSE